MNLGELLLLAASAFVVYALGVIGVATVWGRRHRVPRALQIAVVPSVDTMGAWRRRVYLAIAFAFVFVSQGLLLLWLISGSPRLGDAAIVVAEFALAALLTFYLARPAPADPPRN